MINPRDFGQPFAIHASRVIDEDVYLRIAEIDKELGGGPHLADERWWQLSRITSAVIGVATIDYMIVADDLHGYVGPVDVPPLGDQCRWFFGPIGYVLHHVIALPEPVPCKGRLGFWTLPDEIAVQVEAQVARAA